MFGMDLISFLILLVISVVVSAVLHWGLKYYVIPGLGSYFSKVVIGWIGAWLGSPVFGHWWEGLNYEQVYYIPAILGSLALLILVIDVTKTFGSVSSAEETAAEAAEPPGPEAA